MIEILVGVYIFSLLVSGAFLFWRYLFIRRQIDSSRMQMLNLNLQKVGLFWAYSKGDFSPFSEEAVQRDRRQTFRSLIYMGLLGFGGLLGLLLLMTVLLSLRFLVVNRREDAVWRSALAQDAHLPASEVSKLVHEIEASR